MPELKEPTLPIRKVVLTKGPLADSLSMSSCWTAVHSGEIYVWDGKSNPPDTFIHAKTAILELPLELQKIERKKVQLYSTHPVESIVEGIPPWRLHAWLELLRYGVEE